MTTLTKMKITRNASPDLSHQMVPRGGSGCLKVCAPYYRQTRTGCRERVMDFDADVKASFWLEPPRASFGDDVPNCG
jgi:hypothetical protein